MMSSSAAATKGRVFHTSYKFWFASSCYLGEQDISLSAIALGRKALSNYLQGSQGAAPFIG